MMILQTSVSKVLEYRSGAGRESPLFPLQSETEAVDAADLLVNNN